MRTEPQELNIAHNGRKRISEFVREHCDEIVFRLVLIVQSIKRVFKVANVPSQAFVCILPLFFDRDQNGLPHGWIQMAKESIRSIVPRFSASRMLKEYASRMYVPASRQAVRPITR